MIPFPLRIATSSDVKDSALLGLFPLPIDFSDFLFASSTRPEWLNSGSFLMLEKEMLGINFFFFYLETTSTLISSTYNVSVNIFLKDHRIMSYCTTESVDGQSDLYYMYYSVGHPPKQNLSGSLA